MQGAALVFHSIFLLSVGGKNISLSELATTRMVDMLCSMALIITEMPLAAPRMRPTAHDAHGGAGKAAQFGDHHRVIATDDHVAGLDGDVRGLAAQGNADVGIRQRRGVVDAVADHDYAVALRLQLEHCLGFLLGKELRLIAVCAHELGHGARLCTPS